VSTAHTILYYDRFGPGVFRALARAAGDGERVGEPREGEARFDVTAAMSAMERDRAIWTELVYARRAVSRRLYEEMSAEAPVLRPKRTRVRYAEGARITLVPARRRNTRPNALR
jgi:hypothetical protein